MQSHGLKLDEGDLGYRSRPGISTHLPCPRPQMAEARNLAIKSEEGIECLSGGFSNACMCLLG